MKLIPTLLFVLISIYTSAQKKLNVGGMTFRYEIIQDSIYGFVSAPMKGWILIGFNSEPNLEGADLKFFKIENNIVESSDRKNIGGRNYPADNDLGGENNIRVLDGKENTTGTSFHFAFPLLTKDRNDFQHSLKKSFWLILAYSESDDLQHHSRMRKHLPFSWECNINQYSF